MAYHGVIAREAINMTGATVTMSSLYQRVVRWRKRKAIDDGIMVSNASQSESPAMQLPSSSDASESPAMQMPSSSDARKNLPSSSEARMNHGLDKLRPWMKRTDARQSLMRRARKSPTQAHLSRLIGKCNKTYYGDRYKDAFKAATLAMQMPDSAKGKHGTGVRSVVDRINSNMLSSPNDKKLSVSTVHRAVQRGEFGVSPQKMGRPSTLPNELTQGLACHSVMMQLSGEGEMSSLKMRTLATAITMGTPHERKHTAAHIWKKTRLRHPEYIKPAQAVENEDRRVDWLTYKNIIDWNARAKKFLVDVGMGKDEPGVIRKCVNC